jgi:predicted nucleic acid-binding protein
MKVVLDTKVFVSGIFFNNAAIYSAPPLPESVCDDPDDDKFLACALASGCNLIISGDKHLLAASGYREVEVLKPRVFLERIIQ